ncbi:MAG: hypothetical protein AB7G88_10490 [Thermomicrobiales bacterium]
MVREAAIAREPFQIGDDGRQILILLQTDHDGSHWLDGETATTSHWLTKQTNEYN